MSSAVTVPSGSGPAIQFKDVRIGFDEGDIFRGVSFRVEPRETMILASKIIGSRGSTRNDTPRKISPSSKPMRTSLNWMAGPEPEGTVTALLIACADDYSGNRAAGRRGSP